MTITPRTASARWLALAVGLLALSGCGTSPTAPPVAPSPAAHATAPAPTTTTTTAAAPPAKPAPVTTIVAPQPVVPAIPAVPEPADPPPPAATYFKSCAEAKAAGAAPLHRGDPGYRAGLDRDGDGVACEK